MGKQAAGEGAGLTWVFQQKVEQLELQVKEKTHNLRRLEAQRNELNTQGGGRGRGWLFWLPRPRAPPGAHAPHAATQRSAATA
jgi:hypothetical protein